jgi:hypothetical protein
MANRAGASLCAIGFKLSLGVVRSMGAKKHEAAGCFLAP